MSEELTLIDFESLFKRNLGKYRFNFLKSINIIFYEDYYGNENYWSQLIEKLIAIVYERRNKGQNQIVFKVLEHKENNEIVIQLENNSLPLKRIELEQFNLGTNTPKNDITQFVRFAKGKKLEVSAQSIPTLGNTIRIIISREEKY